MKRRLGIFCMVVHVLLLLVLMLIVSADMRELEAENAALRAELSAIKASSYDEFLENREAPATVV